MYSPLLFEMLAQSRNDEIAAVAEQRRAAAERAEFRPEYQAGVVRFARMLISSVAYEIRRVWLSVSGAAGVRARAD
jgi:hypothetical protein